MPSMPPHMSASMLTRWRRAVFAHRLVVPSSRAIRKPPTRLVRSTVSKPSLIDRCERRRVLAAGVVDQPMDRAVVIEDLRDQRFHHFFIANIAGQPVGAAVSSAITRPLQFLRLAPDQDHLGTEGRQFMGGAAANAAAAAGINTVTPEQVGFEDRVEGHGDIPFIGIDRRCVAARRWGFVQLLGKALPCGSMRRLAIPPPPASIFQQEVEAVAAWQVPVRHVVERVEHVAHPVDDHGQFRVSAIHGR